MWNHFVFISRTPTVYFVDSEIGSTMVERRTNFNFLMTPQTILRTNINAPYQTVPITMNTISGNHIIITMEEGRTNFDFHRMRFSVSRAAMKKRRTNFKKHTTGMDNDGDI